MRTCNEYQELISCMTDGELDANAQAELHAHIEDCENCKLIYQAFSAISESLNGDLAEVPANFTSSVMDKVAPKNKGVLHRHRWMRVAGIAACAALIIIGAGTLNNLFGTRSGSSTPKQNEAHTMAEAPDSRDLSDSETAENYSGQLDAGYYDDASPTAATASDSHSYEIPSPTATPVTASPVPESSIDTVITGEESGIHSKSVIPSFATLELVENSLSAAGAAFSLTNMTDESLTYGEAFTMQVWYDSGWQDVDLSANWLLPAYILDAGETAVLEIDWSDFCGELDPGTYLINKTITDSNSRNYAVICEFEIK